ncbi:Calx-beta domain-containing protein [Maribacter polysiphoniae]|uniref:Calx-beta domain-containing protein n=1 Tax=Maribacter polysiphoniae TaxID=429344 RepID=UPI002357B504|nr:Calx-beta domain-containing protein [Maribacter polysiphoniae]
MKKKRKYTMVTPFQAMSKISKKLLFFGAFLLLSVSGYGQDISIAAISNGEEDGSVNTVFRITSGSSGNSDDIDVTYTIGGVAISGVDYNSSASGTVTIPGDTSGSSIDISIPSIDDNSVEGNEDLIVVLTSADGGAIIIQNTATAFILDDDVSVEFSTASSSDNEDDGGNLPVLLLNGRVNGPTSVTVTDAGSGTATGGGVDYSFTSPTVVNIPADDYDGTLSTSIPIPGLSIGADAIIEGNETIDLELTAFTGDVAFGGQSATTYTISNDDIASASITATDNTATEAGTTNNGAFTVDLGAVNGTGSAITVNFNLSGSAANILDYANIGTSVSIDNGQQTGTVTIDPVDDSLVEGSETVTLTLDTGTGYVIGTPSSATVNITDNDNYTASITATDNIATEAGTTNNGTFTVDLGEINTTGSAITVNFNRSGSATHITDYGSIGTSVLVANGQQTGTVTINPVDDAFVEGQETVTLTLDTGTGYVVGTPSSATVNITDNDNYTATITATDNIATEAGTTDNGTFTVDLGFINTTGSDITVDFTRSGSASHITDYANIGASVLIANGQRTGTVTINPVDDALVEGPETVTLTLDAGTGYVVGTPSSATVTITSDDTSTISINDPAAVNEGDSGTATLNFTVSIDASDPGAAITVDYTISGGNEDSDTGTLTFPAGTPILSQTIPVTTNGDTVVENDEEISVTLNNESANADIAGDGVGESSFTDDDSAGLIIDDIFVNEEDGTATFTITLNGNVFFGTTVTYQTSDDTAVSGDDYTTTSGAVTFGSGNNQTRTINIPLIDDGVLESTETFFVDLTNSTSLFVPIIDNRGIATIEDDDNCAPAPILNTDVQTTFCGTFTYDNGTAVSLNDYTDSTAPAGMVLTWSRLSNPLNASAHLLPSEVDNLANDGSYYGFFYDGDNNCASGTIEVELTLNPIPSIGGTLGDERCGPGEVTLSANAAVDADTPPTFNWYDSATGGNLLGSGPTFTDNISTTTSYFVEATANGCVSERQEVVATIYPAPSAGTTTNTSACSIAANGTSIRDLDDLITGQSNGSWSVTTDPSNSIVLGSDNIVDFEGLTDGSYVFTYTTDDATPPFCDNVSSQVTITVNDCDMDTDLDGLFDGIEAILGTDPNNVDSDGDGIEDGVEVGDDSANLLDEDGDGIIDALDSNIDDTDMDGVVDQLDPANTNPCLPNPDSEFCVATVDLEITKTADVDYLRINEQMTFTITVNNISVENAASIQVSEVLDATGFNYISHFTGAGSGVYDEVAGTWDIPLLNAGDSVSLVILVEAIASGFYDNTATIVEVSPFDIDPDNNEATVTIEVGERSNNECGFLFNQFSPNGDGTNDFLYINCITNPEYAGNSLEIYDRYGNQVFATRDYDNTWDGTRNNKELPKGTYFYILDLADGSEVKKGWIQIIR